MSLPRSTSSTVLPCESGLGSSSTSRTVSAVRNSESKRRIARRWRRRRSEQRRSLPTASRPSSCWPCARVQQSYRWVGTYLGTVCRVDSTAQTGLDGYANMRHGMQLYGTAPRPTKLGRSFLILSLIIYRLVPFRHGAIGNLCEIPRAGAEAATKHQQKTVSRSFHPPRPTSQRGTHSGEAKPRS